MFAFYRMVIKLQHVATHPMCVCVYALDGKTLDEAKSIKVETSIFTRAKGTGQSSIIITICIIFNTYADPFRSMGV